MKQKLRLLLTDKCNRKCDGCCNKDWNLEEIPVCKDFSKYDLIMLTGGEPMLNIGMILSAIEEIRESTNAPIYLYTAKLDDVDDALLVLGQVNGMTITLHEQSDVEHFKLFKKYASLDEKSMRLNVFDCVDISGVDTSEFIVKDNITWIKDCPLPKDEEFMRYV